MGANKKAGCLDSIKAPRNCLYFCEMWRSGAACSTAILMIIPPIEFESPTHLTESARSRQIRPIAAAGDSRPEGGD